MTSFLILYSLSPLQDKLTGFLIISPELCVSSLHPIESHSIAQKPQISLSQTLLYLGPLLRWARDKALPRVSAV